MVTADSSLLTAQRDEKEIATNVAVSNPAPETGATEPQRAATRPYPEVAHALFAAGYSPLPLPERAKDPVPVGWTGHDAPMASYADVQAWSDDSRNARANTAARLPVNVIGLDVDAHDGKPGWETWTSLVDRLGAPPATWVVTSRDDGQSGHRLYRLPEGVDQSQFAGGLPGVDVLRHGHRYVVAPGSVHPEGMVYRCYREDTGELLDGLPPVDTLPVLPMAWVEAFSRAQKAKAEAEAKHRALTEGRPCQAVLTALSGILAALGSGGSRHDAATAGVLKLLRLGDQGHAGVARALGELRAEFVAAVTVERDGSNVGARTTTQALREFEAMITSGLALVDVNPTPDDRRGCCDPLAWLGTGATGQPEPDGDPTPDRFRVTTLSDVTPQRVEWIWPGRIVRGKTNLLDGDPGVGKSTLSVTMAAHVTTGRPWPDGSPCPKGAVLMLSGEDGLADTVRPRLDAAGGDPSKFHVLEGITLGTEDDGRPMERDPHLGDVAEIELAIAEHGVTLLIVDVLMAFLPSGTDSHKDQDIRTVLRRLGGIAERTGCAVLLLRHLNKAQGGSPLYRGGGSIGIVGAARSGLLAARDPDDEDVIVLASNKCNLSAAPPSLAYRLVDGGGVGRVQWVEGFSERSARDLLASRGDDDERDERDALAEFIIGYLTDKGGSAPARDCQKAIAAAFGPVGKNVLTRVRKAAGVTCQRVGFGPGSQVLWTIDPGPESIDPLVPATQSARKYGIYVGSMDGSPTVPEPSEGPTDPHDVADCGHPVGRHGHGGPTCQLCGNWHRTRSLPWPCPGTRADLGPVAS